jgi:Ala-tRNA(Pro) deacylase
MAVSATVQEFLRQSSIPYAVLPHATAYTAREEAAVMHIAPKGWAKAVVCFADGEPIQAVVPADRAVDLDRLLMLTGARTLRLARENELGWLYPDCEPGAMPPLGPIYHQRVFVDSTLAAEDEIVFNAGTHNDAVSMHYRDFAAIVSPKVGPIARRRMP